MPRLKFIVIPLCLAVMLSACGTSSSTPADASDAAEKETVSQRITYAEADMPENTPEEQAYVDKYISPYAVTGLFRRNFEPGNYTELHDNLLTIFNALALARPDNTLVLTDEDTVLHQEIVEDILMAYFDLTPEEIREACADYYDAEEETYTYAYGLGGGPGVFVVTDSRLDGAALSLSYDFYGGDYDNLADAFQYVMLEQGQLQIEIDGDSFRFLSNSVQNAPGID